MKTKQRGAGEAEMIIITVLLMLAVVGLVSIIDNNVTYKTAIIKQCEIGGQFQHASTVVKCEVLPTKKAN